LDERSSTLRAPLIIARSFYCDVHHS
jgi:hypothetical protein